MTNKVLYILYNADASVMGKLRYSYRKITGPKDCDAECAACELTHGGLSLKETSAWLEARTEIENSSDIKVVQWHRDELSSQVKSYVEEHRVAYPVALLEGDGQLRVIMDRTELGKCNGDAQMFVKELRAKGVLRNSSGL